jgi:hypothetical protein
MLKKVSDAKDQILEAGISSNEKVTALLEEYKHAISSLTAFGLRVGKIHIVIGVFPEISTSIIGSINQIDTKSVKELMYANPDKKLLRAILSAILTAASIRDVVELGNLGGFKMDIVLGVPPRISVELN